MPAVPSPSAVATAIGERVTQQVSEAGYSRRSAADVAALWESFFRTLAPQWEAEGLEFDPAAIAQEFGIGFQSTEFLERAAVAAEPEDLSQTDTTSEAFRAWFGDSKVVDESDGRGRVREPQACQLRQRSQRMTVSSDSAAAPAPPAALTQSAALRLRQPAAGGSHQFQSWACEKWQRVLAACSSRT